MALLLGSPTAAAYGMVWEMEAQERRRHRQQKQRRAGRPCGSREARAAAAGAARIAPDEAARLVGHVWLNEIPSVPFYYLAKPQPRERVWDHQRGKRTLLSLTLVRLCEMT